MSQTQTPLRRLPAHAIPSQWDERGRPVSRPQPTLERERSFRKQRLAAAFRLFGHFGWDHGGAGHITVRDPEFPDSFWVNPFGVHFSHVRVSDLLRVNHHAEVVEGGEVRRLNRAA